MLNVTSLCALGKSSYRWKSHAGFVRRKRGWVRLCSLVTSTRAPELQSTFRLHKLVCWNYSKEAFTDLNPCNF